MYQYGKNVSATARELVEMKENQRMLARFISLSESWIKAQAYIHARKTPADADEWNCWLRTGLWQAIMYNDGRAETTGLIYKIAIQQAFKGYQAAYESATARRLRESASMTHKDDDGAYVEVDIVDEDKALSTVEFDSFMSSIQSKVSERDYYVIQSRLNGKTFEDIGEAIELSKQMAYKIWKNHLPKLKAYA